MIGRPPGHVLILADGDVGERAALDAAWPGWSDGIDFVIAADGGARHGPGLGVALDLWVGDGDSLGEAGLARIRAAGVPTEPAGHDKDESDTELALVAAARLGAGAVTILGAFGGERLDHGLANVGLLLHPAATDRPVVLVDARARVRLARAPGPAGAPVVVDLAGRIGDIVSLLPFGVPATGLTTSGLRYPLHDGRLDPGPARGLSNVRTDAAASVALGRGVLLVIETPATLRP